MTIQESINKGTQKMLAERIAKLIEIDAPKIMIDKSIENLQAIRANGVKVSGDSSLLNIKAESLEIKTGSGGVSYIVYNGYIHYYPNAKYGAYISIKKEKPLGA